MPASNLSNYQAANRPKQAEEFTVHLERLNLLGPSELKKGLERLSGAEAFTTHTGKRSAAKKNHSNLAEPETNNSSSRRVLLYIIAALAFYYFFLME